MSPSTLSDGVVEEAIAIITQVQVYNPAEFEHPSHHFEDHNNCQDHNTNQHYRPPGESSTPDPSPDLALATDIPGAH